MDFRVRLTRNEAIFLSDALSIRTEGASPDVRAYPALLLKIGTAFLELTEDGGAVESGISLALDELWMVREVAKSGVQVGSEKVGMSLLRKAYEGIRQLSAQDQVHDAVMQVGESAEDSPEMDDQTRHRLNEWQTQDQQNKEESTHG